MLNNLFTEGHVHAWASTINNLLGCFWSVCSCQPLHHHRHGLREDPQSVRSRTTIFGKHSLLITDEWWSNLRIYSNLYRSFPINFILLALFTAAESVIVGQVSGGDKSDKSDSKVLRKPHNISRHHDEHHHHYLDQHQHDLRQRWCTTGRCWWSRWPPRPFLSSPSLFLLSRY